MEEIKKSWVDIFRAFRMAFDPKKLMLAFGGIIASIVSLMILTGICKHFGLISIGPKSVISSTLFFSNLCPYEMLLQVFKSMMVFSVGKLIVSLCLIIDLLIIWSVVGGAITRLSSIEYAKDDSLRLVEALKFALRKFWSYFWSPIVPAIGVIFFALCNVLVGFIGKLGVFGNMFVAFGFPLTLLSSFMVAFIGIIGVVGLCLMFPTISAEGSDAFDAMSRAYSYVLSKPRKFIAYFFTSTCYGIFCIVLVGAVACFVINITFDTVGIGMGQKFKDITEAIKITPDYCSIVGVTACDFKAGLSSLDHWSDKFAAVSILLSLLVVKILVFSFGCAYVGSAKTIVYFLMRKEVDETEITDVYVEEKETEKENAPIEKAENKGSASDKTDDGTDE